jgi:hypothetical protein
MTVMDKYFVVEPGAESHGPVPPTRVGPPPGVTPPPASTPPPTFPPAHSLDAMPVIETASSFSWPAHPVAAPIAPEPPVVVEDIHIDQTNPVDPLDEEWDGDTVVHDEQPIYVVAPDTLPSANRIPARGTEPPPVALTFAKPADDPPPVRFHRKKLVIGTVAALAAAAVAVGLLLYGS